MNVTPVAVPGASGLLTGFSRYRGVALDNTSSTARAKVRIRAGSSSGLIVDTIDLQPDESTREFYESAITCAGGIYVELVSGAVEGTIRAEAG